MNDPIYGSDASFYYRASSALDTAATDSSALWGNLADAMKDAIVLMPSTWIFEPLVVVPFQVKDAPNPPSPEPFTKWREGETENFSLT
ncbi:MAG: hypothetical protein OXH77_10045 [Anaerolineaceae bacterium]|nr:hypothetical protein [Anaerolineaceae bacterium]